MDDRDVILKGRHLEGRRIDFVVGGGIAAVEAVKVIRELRRYGAEVRVVMSRGALSFVQPLVFEWASKNKVVTELSGSAEHLSAADAAVVFPATLDLIGRLAHGLADDAALTALQGMLGRKPLIFSPSMHDRLWENPLFQKNMKTLANLPQNFFIAPTEAEGKKKSPSPEEIVQKTVAILSTSPLRGATILVSAGATKSAIDDVRFVSNESSGATGLAIAEELFRRGARVLIAKGKVSVSFPPWIEQKSAESVDMMKAVLQGWIKRERPKALIMAAALLDFDVSRPLKGKTASSKRLAVDLKASQKVIDLLTLRGLRKIGFKYEVGLSESQLKARVTEWNKIKKCDLVIANERTMVERSQRSPLRAILYDRDGNEMSRVKSNEELALFLGDWLASVIKR